jgi:hypothetical protein
MAYKSKYYDPQKAHEYYMKHRKLKGRKKKTSTADLSDAGKIAAKEVKEQLQAELKAALKKVKRGNTAERQRLRELFQKKYEAELDEIRKDSSMVKAPKQKAVKQPKSAKASGGSKASSKSTKAETKAQAKAETKAETKAEIAKETSVATETERITNAISQLRDKFSSMTDEQKATARDLIKKLMAFYKR